MNWYYRMTTREIGVPHVAVDEHYLNIARRAIGKGEIEDQMTYHRMNAPRMKWVGFWLEVLGYLLFGFTLLICLYEVAAHYQSVPKASQCWQVLFHMLTIVLPAGGAALRPLLSNRKSRAAKLLFNAKAQRRHNAKTPGKTNHYARSAIPSS